MAPVYVDILWQILVPFIASVYLYSHRFMQDNDPKHTSKLGESFLSSNRVNWWKTPPESPDLNPIENLWHELKEHLRREVKARNKDELVTLHIVRWCSKNAVILSSICGITILMCIFKLVCMQ